MEAQRLGVPLEEELHWRSLEPNLGQWGRSVQANGTGSPQWTWGLRVHLQPGSSG